jgi:hypothetical protein
VRDTKNRIGAALGGVHREVCRSRVWCEGWAGYSRWSSAGVHGEGPLTCRSESFLGFCCARRPAAPTIRDRAGTPGDHENGVGMQELERITARRSELDTLTEELAKQLQEVQAERTNW